jgi:hypothetical protein
VAIRARYHIIDKDHDLDLSICGDGGEEHQRFHSIEKAVQVHQKSKNVMYFA